MKQKVFKNVVPILMAIVFGGFALFLYRVMNIVYFSVWIGLMSNIFLLGAYCPYSRFSSKIDKEKEKPYSILFTSMLLGLSGLIIFGINNQIIVQIIVGAVYMIDGVVLGFSIKKWTNKKEKSKKTEFVTMVKIYLTIVLIGLLASHFFVSYF